MPLLDLPFHLPLTADEFNRMPPAKGLRIELWEGNLDISAAMQIAWHGLVTEWIWRLVEISGQIASNGIGVTLTERTVRVPDVTRFRAGYQPELRRSQFHPADVDLVVEIVSPESQTRDRVIKPEEYAAAGIPEFWLVEEHPEDEADALVNICQLSTTGHYELARSVDLSTLEQESEG